MVLDQRLDDALERLKHFGTEKEVSEVVVASHAVCSNWGVAVAVGWRRHLGLCKYQHDAFRELGIDHTERTVWIVGYTRLEISMKPP